MKKIAVLPVIFLIVFECIISSYASCDRANHAWASISKTEPTCTQPGEEIFKCVACGNEKTEEIPAEGHTWEVVKYIFEPTCLEGGSAVSVCTKCGTEVTGDVPPRGHSGELIKLHDATCKVPAVYEGKCEVCGAGYNKTSDPLGHSFSYIETKNATCTEDGYDLYVCVACLEEEKRNVTEKHHEFVIEDITEPLCDVSGSIKKVCTVCGYILNEEVSPTGHEWNEPVTQIPTGLFSDGKLLYTCKHDESHIKYENTKALFSSDQTTKFTCIYILASLIISASLTAVKYRIVKNRSC